MDTLTGRTVLVTGAAGAIGAALAQAFAAECARLVLTDIDRAGVERVRAALPDTAAIAVEGDLTDPDAVARIVAAADDAFGGVDILVNNAAVSVYAPAWIVPVDLVDWMYRVNVLGTLHMLQAVVPAMISRGSPAHVVNIASMAGLISGPTLAGYSASKHAVVGLTDGLRRDLQQAGAPIDVTLVAPGPVKTGGVAAMRGRVGQVADPAVRALMLTLLDETEKLVRAGIDPEDVARQVVLAVRHRIFWVTCPPTSVRAVTMRADEAIADSARMTALLAG